MTDHLCDEVCEATGMGTAAFRDAPIKGTQIHVTACTVHERCLIVAESDSHYQRTDRANCDVALERVLNQIVPGAAPVPLSPESREEEKS